MKMIIDSDHAGFEARHAVMSHLTKLGIEFDDVGPEAAESCDYADFAHKVADAVAAGEVDLGVLICGSGQGMAMAANRHRGVRAALITDSATAEMARLHNDANVACFGQRVVGTENIPGLLDIFLNTEYEGERHQRRIEKIDAPLQGQPRG